MTNVYLEHVLYDSDNYKMQKMNVQFLLSGTCVDFVYVYKPSSVIYHNRLAFNYYEL